MAQRDTVQCNAHKLVNDTGSWTEEARKAYQDRKRNAPRCTEAAVKVYYDRPLRDNPEGYRYVYVCQKHANTYGKVHRWTYEDIPLNELPDDLAGQIIAYHQRQLDQAEVNLRYHERMVPEKQADVAERLAALHKVLAERNQGREEEMTHGG